MQSYTPKENARQGRFAGVLRRKRLRRCKPLAQFLLGCGCLGGGQRVGDDAFQHVDVLQKAALAVVGLATRACAFIPDLGAEAGACVRTCCAGRLAVRLALA